MKTSRNARMQYTLSTGETVAFSSEKLKKVLFQKKLEADSTGKKFNQQSYLMDISEATGISFSSLKHWLQGHNSPSDLEKVKDLANILGVDMLELLETEKEHNMNTTEVMHSNPDLTVPYSEKDAIRKIYQLMVCYLESLRFELSTDEFQSGKAYVSRFAAIHTSIEQVRLDIPTALFKQLHDFAVNYLQLIPSYVSCCNELEYSDAYNNIDLSDAGKFWSLYCDNYTPWESYIYMDIQRESDVFARYKAAVITQYEIDVNSDGVGDIAGHLLQTAYTELERILENYLM